MDGEWPFQECWDRKCPWCHPEAGCVAEGDSYWEECKYKGDVVIVLGGQDGKD